MKNKFLIGTITFFITMFIIILLNTFESETKKHYSFDRRFESNQEILKFEKKSQKLNENEYVMSINSDNNIVERDIISKEKDYDTYKFFIRDLNFTNEQINEVKIPKGSNILFCDNTLIIYSNYFKLYKYDLKTNISSEIKLDNLKVNSIIPIANSKTEFLCFAEYKVSDEYITGFYFVDFETKKIKLSKLLENDKTSSVPKNALIYSGKFAKFQNEKIISYYCDKFSKIYFFNNNGKYLKELTTLDETPKPIITKNQQGFSFYSRKGAWNTNMGMFLKEGKIFVLSASNENYSDIIIDEYLLSDLKYIQSYKINYNNQSTYNVRNVFSTKNSIIIGFEYDYASFIFAKHI